MFTLTTCKRDLYTAYMKANVTSLCEVDGSGTPQRNLLCCRLLQCCWQRDLEQICPCAGLQCRLDMSRAQILCSKPEVGCAYDGEVAMLIDAAEDSAQRLCTERSAF